MKRILPTLGALLLSVPLLTAADNSAMTTAKPLTPQQALASLVTEPGLRVELVAAEPLTASPCAVAWDERGRMFVVENRGYPTGPGSNHTPAGIIALLESTKHDGVYDKRTVFATGLTFPNGIMCWRGGVIVTCAPDIFFLQDTNGDGRADVKKVLLTSFNTSSTTQLRVSHPTLGLDGYIHVTSGLVASKVTCPEHPERGAIDLPRGDARFHPDTLEIEPWPGVGQFGLAFDDFGRKFICSNRNPLQHVVLHPRYLKRNPFLAFSDTVQDVAPFGDAGKCWPLSEDHTTAAFIPSLMSAPHAGTFTSACGISLWRGGALPASLANSAFICEPAQNLVQRQVLTPDGPTFKSAPATPGREFLATRDTWFRPVFSATGPDGALYICDMYRKVIDHPQYLPEHIRGSLDYEAGKTNGRIWRVVPANLKSPISNPKLNFAAASTQELVAKLNDANGWVRTTAFRLLKESNDSSTTNYLKVTLQADAAHTPQAQVMALRLLETRSALDRPTLDASLKSKHGPVRENAVSLYEPRLPGYDLARLRVEPPELADLPRGSGAFGGPNWPHPLSWKSIVYLLERLSADEDAKVRFQLALIIGEVPPQDFRRGGVMLGGINPGQHHPLVALGAKDGTNRWSRAAIFSSLQGDSVLGMPLTSGAHQEDGTNWSSFVREIGFLRGTKVGKGDLYPLLGSGPSTESIDGMAYLAGLMAGARSAGAGPVPVPNEGKVMGEMALVWGYHNAKERLADVRVDTATKVSAVEFLAHSDFTTAGAALQSLIAPQVPNELQAAAVRALSQLPGAQAGAWFVERERWRGYTPPVRDAVLNALLSQPALQLVLLDAVEKGVVQPWAVPANRRGPLLKHKDAAVAARAAKAFQPQGAADRMKVYEDYKAVLALPANGKNGHAIFTKTCAACHQFAGEGARVGPELTGVRNQPAEALLLHIIVPDAEIYPGFTAYEVETKDGRSLTGLLASDTPTSVTLRAAQGVEETILRSNIAKLTSSSTSLMPNELEKTMTRQEMADLIAFLKGQ